MSAGDLRVYVLRSLSEMESVRDSWTALVLMSPDSTPFQTWEWIYGMAKFEGERRVRLRVLLAENGHGALVGLAPFMIRSRSVLEPPILEFIGGEQSDYCQLLFLEPYRDAFICQVIEWIERNKEWKILNLQNLRQGPIDSISRWSSFDVREFDICPYVRLPCSMEEYEQKVLQKRLRTTIRQQLRLLAREGRLEISISRTASEVQTHLPVFFDLHQRRRRAKGDHGIFTREERKKAFYEMSLSLAQAGYVRVGVLWIDKQPAASIYNLRMQDREYYYLSGMDPNFARYRPGSLLTHWLIQTAIKDGMRMYDFLRGNEPYKLLWTNEICQTFQLMRARSKLDALLWQKQRSLRAALLKNPLVKAVYDAIRDRSPNSMLGMSKTPFPWISSHNQNP